ncbi:uncharacterized protein LOC123537170 [Mercenaria mercenaria]|uniref:uncharacterized protein LOC123537170 n=1 Tax=Mercenaria mercenaria TaxID=6596 RepID=UPI00234E831C|nr:uncharacterized protein LOC123537170 [Mercenaria mercenaria]
MASGKSDKTRIEVENDDFEEETTTSDYLLVSGSASSTIKSDFTSLSRPNLSIRGSDFTGMDTPSVLSIADPETGSDDVSEMLDELQLGDSLAKGNIPKDKPVKSGKKLCSNCVVDGKQTEATHLCKSCKPDGRYICHKCLQSHNRWSLDHFVVSLSVEDESSVRSGKETNEDSSELIAPQEHLPYFQDEVISNKPEDADSSELIIPQEQLPNFQDKLISNIPEVTDSSELIISQEHLPNIQDEVISNIPEVTDIRECLNIDTREVSEFQEKLISDTSKTETESNQNYRPNSVEQEPDRSGTLHHPKIRRLRGDYYGLEKDINNAQKKGKPRFYDDKLYREIVQDQRYKYPSQTTDKSFTKYGTYSIRTDADTKPCFVTGTCQLQDGRIVITDSENCRLKILDPNRFKVTASRKLQSNPCSISYMKEKNVVIAFADCEVAIVDILEEIEIRSSFKIKHVCKGLAYGNGSLYVCTGHMIEIYSETGDMKTSLQPISTDVKIRCPTSINISKNGDIIYVSDKDKGIVVMDEEGHILNTISDNVYEPNLLCLDVSGKLFATEMSSCRVLKVDPEIGNVKQVIREVCQKDYPISLCHERIFNRLIVGVWQSDSIHVFTCS